VCHDAPAHHFIQAEAPTCATCHAEHRGRIDLTATSDAVCAHCHRNLQKIRSGTGYAPGITSLQSWHPEFAALRRDGPNYGRDLGQIKLNHAVHMRPIRRGPNGPDIQLQCENCHHATATGADLTYSDPSYRAATVSYKESEEGRLIAFGTLNPAKPPSRRELMVPVRFADACAGCHSLQFDKRFDFGVPHDTPQVVRAFVQKKFQEYIAAHPSELRVARDPDRELTGNTVRPEFRALTPAQWVKEQSAKAEELLWRKTCAQCHIILMSLTELHPTLVRRLVAASEVASESSLFPKILNPSTTVQWLPHAKFDHDAHRGFSCAGCHPKALTSTESSDILVPGVANCKTCHAPGPEHAESRCFECHTYHDWSKRKEVKATFTLPALEPGGR